MRRAVHHRAHGVDGAESEIVVKVRRELDAPFAYTKRLHEPREIVVHAFRREDAAGIGETEPRPARLDACVGPFDRVREVASTRIFGGEFDPFQSA